MAMGLRRRRIDLVRSCGSPSGARVGYYLRFGTDRSVSASSANTITPASSWCCSALRDAAAGCCARVSSIGALLAERRHGRRVITAPFDPWLIAGKHDLVALYGSARWRQLAGDEPPQGDADRSRQGDLCAAGFLFPLDLIVLVLFPGARREGWAAIKRAVPTRTFERGEPDWRLLLLHITIGGFIVLDLWRAVDRRHALSRAVHASLLLAHAVVADRAGARQSGNSSRRHRCARHGARRRHADRGALRLRDALHAMGADCRKCRIGVPYDGTRCRARGAGLQERHVDRRGSPTTRGICAACFPRRGSSGLEPPAYAPPMVRATSPRRWRWSGAKSRIGRLPKETLSEFTKIAGNARRQRPSSVVVPWQPYPARPRRAV